LPAWWSGFLFHVLNPRQVATFVYLAMLCDATGTCHPTIEQMREDLGLLSTTMVFEALSVLEELGFIVRERQAFPDSRSRRNLYRRTACEYTILRLVQRGRLDGSLSPSGRREAAASEESRQLMDEGLRIALGDRFERYARASTAAKRAVLEEELEAILRHRAAGIYA
jgi:SOS-response transcriptional repressor LexA